MTARVLFARTARRRRRGRSVVTGATLFAAGLVAAGLALPFDDRSAPMSIVHGERAGTPEVTVFRGGNARGTGATTVPTAASLRPAFPAATIVDARFTRCQWPPYEICVVDGDTFYLNGTPVRVADIDAPEIGSPACPAEAHAGDLAAQRLLALLNEGPFAVAPSEGATHDRHGRALRILRRDGVSLGAVLVGEGLARRWDGPDIDWCR